MSKIGFYCSSVSWGGLEMNFTKYAYWISQRGYSVLVYCVKNTPISEAVVKYGLPHCFVKRNRKYFDLYNAYKIYQFAKRDNIKAIWLRDSRDISTIGISKFLSGNSFKLIYQQAMQIGVSKRDIVHTIRFSRIDAWISPLDFLAKQVTTLTRFNPKKIFVIPLATEIGNKTSSLTKEQARAQLDLPNSTFIMGIIGRIDPLKGQLFLIEALAKLKDSEIDVQLLIVGDSTHGEGIEYKQQILQTIDKLGLIKLVHFKPFMTDVTPFYSAIDLFIMASKGETFGTVTVEAMTFGVPVLGTNSAGTPEILKSGELGYLYEVDDIIGFCEKVEEIANNPTQVSQKSELAKKTALHDYNINTVCAKIEDLLLKLDLSNCKQSN